MAIVKLSDGRVLSTYKVINDLIAPNKVGVFKLFDQVEEKSRNLNVPLVAEQADYFMSQFDALAGDSPSRAGLVYRRFGCVMGGTHQDPDDLSRVSFSFYPGSSGVMTLQEVADFQGVPHSKDGAERDYVFCGLVAKGLVLDSDLQAAVYVGPGEWLHLAPGTRNWAMTPYDAKTAVLGYHGNEPDPENGMFEFEYFPDIELLV